MHERTAVRRGLFVTLEGPDGAGKSSQAELLTEHLRGLGRDVVLTREPGGTQLGELVRGVLLQSSADAHDGLSDALLFNAARRRLAEEVIRPAMARGAVVICDRFADSTLAYQGYGGGVALDVLASLAAISIDGLTPHRTVLIDLPVNAGLSRRHGGATADLTRFELAAAHDVEFHDRVRRGYLELAAAEPDRWRVVDGAQDREAVAAAIWSAVKDLFEEG